MATINDRVFDNGLTVLDTEADEIHVTSQEATTYAATTDGSITGSGTVTHYAIVDTANSRLLATGDLVATQVVTSGNTFTLSSVAIGIPDPA